MFEQIRAVIETANTELSLRLAPADMDALSERIAAGVYPPREVEIDDATINMILRQMPSMVGFIAARPMPEGIEYHPIDTSNDGMTAEQVKEAFRAATSEIRADDWQIHPAPVRFDIGTLKSGDTIKFVTNTARASSPDKFKYEVWTEDDAHPDGTPLKIGVNGKMVPCDKDDPERCGSVLRSTPPFGKAPFEPFANALAEAERDQKIGKAEAALQRVTSEVHRSFAEQKEAFLAQHLDKSETHELYEHLAFLEILLDGSYKWTKRIDLLNSDPLGVSHTEYFTVTINAQEMQATD